MDLLDCARDCARRAKQIIGVATVATVVRMALPRLWNVHGVAGAVDRHAFDDYPAGV